MLGAIGSLAMPALGGAIGGGGGGSGLPSTSANSSIGPTNVNPSASSGSGDRGVVNNVVTFPGVRDDKWELNAPTERFSFDPKIGILMVSFFLVVIVAMAFRKKG